MINFTFEHKNVLFLILKRIFKIKTNLKKLHSTIKKCGRKIKKWKLNYNKCIMKVKI